MRTMPLGAPFRAWMKNLSEVKILYQKPLIRSNHDYKKGQKLAANLMSRGSGCGSVGSDFISDTRSSNLTTAKKIIAYFQLYKVAAMLLFMICFILKNDNSFSPI